MVSNFIDESGGFLALTEEEVKRRDEEDPTVPLLASEVIEVGAEHDGYYDSDKFHLQIAKAACIAAFKYSPLRYDVYSVFNQAKTHTAYTADALIASKMNKNPGRAQPVTRVSPFIVHGALQRMVLPGGTPKGLKMVLEEGGVNVRKRRKMTWLLSSHPLMISRMKTIKFNAFRCDLKCKHYFCQSSIQSLTQLSMFGKGQDKYQESV